MKILLADDHALFRESLSLALLRLADEPPKILQAENGDEALNIAKQQATLELILLDLDMPNKGGLDIIQSLKVHHPNTPIVMISAHEDTPSINQALANGASGFIPKTTTADVTLSALQLVLSGGIYLPPQLMQHAQVEAKQKQNNLLTARQIEVLRLLQKGEQNKNIAFELDLSPSTIKVHIRRIFTALGARNRTEAVDIGIKSGIL